MDLLPLVTPPVLPSFAARAVAVRAPGGGGPALRRPHPGTAAAALETLHPMLWRAHQLGRSAGTAVPSGFAALDAELPGGGWPRRALSELLLAQPGIGEIRLLAGALSRLMQDGRSVMLFDPPALPCANALAALGLALPQLVVVRGRGGFKQRRAAPEFLDRAAAGGLGGAQNRLLPCADTLWALEQALKSGHVGAVLAWLPPRVRADALRRLQLAAQAHDGPAFLLREATAAARPSAAPLRLMLRPAGADRLAVRIVKRRGPVLERSLVLELPAVLPAVVQLRLRAARAVQTLLAQPA